MWWDIGVSGTSARSYRPGSWFAIAGERALVLLPPSEKPRVAALWELVDDGAGFDVTLDALISGGLRDLPTFVLVATEEGRTEVVIRGDAAARFAVEDEEVVVDGAEATTWAERTLTGVTRVSVEVEPDPGSGGTAYVVAGGVFRVSRIDQAPDSEPPVRSLHVVSDEDSGEVVAIPAAPWPEPEPEPQSEPATEDEPETDPETEPETEPVAVVDDLVLPTVPPPPPRPPILPPMPEGYRSDADPGEVQEAPVTVAVISTGEQVVIDRITVLGRAPETKEYDYDEEPQLITVPSAHMEISSAHLELRPGGGDALAVATDLGSTNGTVVVQPGAGPHDLAPGDPVDLRPGALVDIGDGVTIQISQG
jgi:hypothetical protein